MLAWRVLQPLVRSILDGAQSRDKRSLPAMLWALVRADGASGKGGLAMTEREFEDEGDQREVSTPAAGVILRHRMRVPLDLP